MPRMSKKRKQELSFYLNDRGRVTYNELCRKCQHGCIWAFLPKAGRLFYLSTLYRKVQVLIRNFPFFKLFPRLSSHLTSLNTSAFLAKYSMPEYTVVTRMTP